MDNNITVTELKILFDKHEVLFPSTYKDISQTSGTEYEDNYFCNAAVILDDILVHLGVIDNNDINCKVEEVD